MATAQKARKALPSDQNTGTVSRCHRTVRLRQECESFLSTDGGWSHAETTGKQRPRVKTFRLGLSVRVSGPTTSKRTTARGRSATSTCNGATRTMVTGSRRLHLESRICLWRSASCSWRNSTSRRSKLNWWDDGDAMDSRNDGKPHIWGLPSFLVSRPSLPVSCSTASGTPVISPRAKKSRHDGRPYLFAGDDPFQQGRIPLGRVGVFDRRDVRAGILAERTAGLGEGRVTVRGIDVDAVLQADVVHHGLRG